jgi:hypothetical protein
MTVSSDRAIVKEDLVFADSLLDALSEWLADKFYSQEESGKPRPRYDQNEAKAEMRRLSGLVFGLTLYEVLVFCGLFTKRNEYSKTSDNIDALSEIPIALFVTLLLLRDDAFSVKWWAAVTNDKPQTFLIRIARFCSDIKWDLAWFKRMHEREMIYNLVDVLAPTDYYYSLANTERNFGALYGAPDGAPVVGFHGKLSNMGRVSSARKRKRPGVVQLEKLGTAPKSDC